ncbi:MAG: response regulator [Clostridia bacterium]|nr:response regulator [Clostridia bacterium]
MLKVLIADDEEKVCQLIRGLIPWDTLGFRVVGFAHDGVTALSMLREHMPDLLITDIRMPGLDGIQLIGEAKQFLPNLLSIIISGYRHFDYAHNAIKYGVEDYLLKPIQREELIQTLEKLRAVIKRADEAHPNPSAEAFVHDLFYGALTQDDLASERVLAKYSLRLRDAGPFFALMIKADLAGVPARDSVRRIASERITAVFKQVPLIREMAVAQLPEGACALIRVAPDDAPALGDALLSARDKAELMRDLFPTLRVSIGISRPARKLQETAGLFAQAYAALETRLLNPASALSVGRPAPAIELSLRAIILADTQKQLQTALGTMQPTLYAAALRAGFSQMRDAASGNMPCLRALLVEMARLHFEFLPIQATLKDLEEMTARLTDAWNASIDIGETEAAFVRLLTDHMQAVITAQQQVEQLPLRRAKAYIREHYDRPLTLEEVSNVAGFNPAYFSTLFKKETGEGFLEYLSSVRIGAAKRLLTDTADAIPAIAECTGYSDPKYFGRQFKKNTGLSPQEYRKMYS